MSNYVSAEFDPDARMEVKEAQIDRDQGRSTIDVVYDTLVEKVDYFNSLIRDAENDIKHWKLMKQEFETLIKAIDKRK